VPAGLVQNEDGVRAGLELLGEGSQEQAHGREGRFRQGQREGLVAARAAGREQVEAREALVGQPGRSHAALVPTVAGPALLADPGLILAPQLEPGVRMCGGDRGQLRPKFLF
jgi:hypothetical protein